MQAIKTKYLGATNTRGSRIKAMCDADEIIIPWDYELSTEANHDSARKALQLKLAKNGEKQFGWNFLDDPWMRPMVGGALPNNEGYAFVFVGDVFVGDWK